MKYNPWHAQFKKDIFYQASHDFERTALALFQYQAAHNETYAHYLTLRKIIPEKIERLEDIPFLPISFFKTKKIQTGNIPPEAIFSSSTTTGQIPSKHFIADIEFYHQNCEHIFEQYFGPVKEWIFMPLLPSYAERKGSSLVQMVNYFISKSANPHTKYYLYNYDVLKKDFVEFSQSKNKICIMGVTFALTDMAEEAAFDFSKAMIIETGGMKGRKKEMVRAELHELLKNRFNVQHIVSEYGMTELLSQAYALENGIFTPPITMKIFVRDMYDPYAILPAGNRGGLNVIDVANVDSCAFIETQDIVSLHKNGNFEILGRIDHSDIRGCNLMVG